jgi:two-component system chemotaxis response regulator CheY
MEALKLKKFVLVVEDEPYLQTVLSAVMQEAGYGVVIAASSREAMQKLRKQAFFCVVTDIALGDGSGEDVIEYIRNSKIREVNKATPIVVVSAYVDKSLLQKVAKKVNGIFVKPFKPEELRKKLVQLEANPTIAL